MQFENREETRLVQVKNDEKREEDTTASTDLALARATIIQTGAITTPFDLRSSGLQLTLTKRITIRINFPDLVEYPI